MTTDSPILTGRARYCSARGNRTPAHLDRASRGFPQVRQGDVEQTCGTLGIVEEQLVEIAHPVETTGGPGSRLDAQILHMGVCCSRFIALRGSSVAIA